MASLITERAMDAYEKNCGSRKEAFWCLYDLIETENLAQNSFNGYTTEIKCPNGSIITINNKCKIVRILGKIAKAFNLEGYEEFRIAHSMCFNQKHLKGDLCISIHPLDYLTMSDNEHNWHSCMSWKRIGDYRLGTVEMMNSPYVVVAYLKSNDKAYEISNGFCWNSKIWRELFIVDKDLILGIKGYPYAHSELELTVMNTLRELVEKNLGWDQFTNQINHIVNDELNLIDDKKYDIKIETNCMYNDIYDTHSAYLSKEFPNPYTLNYSGEVICVSCGQYFDSSDYGSDYAHHLTCTECTPVHRCAECGDFIDENDVCWIGDQPLCSYCYDEVSRECDSCEDICYASDLNHVYLSVGDKNTGEYARICEDCAQKLVEEVFPNGFQWKIVEDDWFVAHRLTANLKDVDLDKHGWTIMKIFEILPTDWKNLLDKYKLR